MATNAVILNTNIINFVHLKSSTLQDHLVTSVMEPKGTNNRALVLDAASQDHIPNLRKEREIVKDHLQITGRLLY